MRIRLTYQRDIDREGTDVIDVDEGRARGLVKLRRAVILDDTVATAAPAAKKTTAKKTTRRRKAQ